MSVLPAAKRSMRIIALPLTTASRTPATSSSGHLSYYHFVTSSKKEDAGSKWMHWVTAKASELWAGFGKAPEGHWKRKTFLYGERLVDRIDFEELALKTLDPSLGPKISRFGHTGEGVKPEDHPGIPLIFPSAVCSSPLEHMQALLAKRTPRHRRGFYMWMIIAPLTAPFMIIPIIPNLPFFFCVWRSWSHYRAYKASSYLEQILARGAIVPQPNKELDAVYAKYAPPIPSATQSEAPPDAKAQQKTEDASSNAESEQAPPGKDKLLLTRDAVPALAETLGLRPGSSFASDLYRALEQARLRIEGAAGASKSS